MQRYNALKGEVPGSMTVRFVYWKDEDMWLGYLEEFPDYWTQGVDLKELQENLKDLYRDLTNDAIPNVRRVAELQIGCSVAI
jgi:predicted RNase H-like HicB family nuclease